MAVKVLTPEEMRRADRKAIEELGIPSLNLMERAGSGLASFLEDLYREKLENAKVAIFCGKGNNGGDGLVSAVHLHRKVKELKVFLLCDETEFSGDAQYQLKRATGEGIQIKSFKEFLRENQDYDVYIDAIFGTGFRGKLENHYFEVIEKINSQKGLKIACDIPSGVNGETGAVENTAFKADYTITFAFPKTGLLLYPGKYYAGKVEIVDIGIPENIIASNKFLLEADDVKNFLPEYRGDEHKGSCGKVLIVSGSKEFTGAPFFVAEASVNSGAGLVYLAVPEEIRPTMQTKCNEVIIRSYKKIENFREICKGDYDVIAFGPGLGRNQNTISLLREILKLKTPKIIDADGIWALAELDAELTPADVVTPHPGEASFLLKGTSPAEINKNRVNYVQKLASKLKSTVVLKGAPTVVGLNNLIFFNSTGNPGMAVGGMGDVLTGILAGLYPRIRDSLKTSLLGVFLHGLSADLLLERDTFETITPSKVLNNLNSAFKKVRS
ncbi:MAG: NAD(P)H-hydrate dehydratase [bacterium]|nr:NAD(P)H-hydrate dehydratase [bacterium]